MTKPEREQKAAKARYHKLVHQAKDPAIAAGFRRKPGRGFWKALRAWREAHGVKHPAVKKSARRSKA